MRFLELSLIAFGPFTDRRIDLSAGNHGVHLLFGPNEAGKSTALRAVSDLLYGIPHDTKDGHLHDNRALRLGARLRRADGTELELIRRKGLKRTLLGPNEEPLPDDVLEPFLGGVTRELFTTMFALDHPRLMAGAASLLEGQGQLGASLYGASLGSTSLHRVLKQLEREADELYNARATKPKINQGLKRLSELEKKARDAALPAQEWRRVERELEELEERRSALAAERQELEVELAKLQRIAQVLPKIGLFEERQREREALVDVPLLAPDAAEQRRLALRLLDEAARERDKCDKQLATLRARLTALPGSDAILEAEPRIVALKERLAGHRRDREELPELDRELERLERERVKLEGSVERSSTPSVKPRRTVKLRLQTLARRHDALRAELARIEAAIVELSSAGVEPPSPGAAVDPAELRAALQVARREGDLELRAGGARRSVTTLEAEAARALARLGSWTGTLEALQTLALPAEETIERFEKRFEENAAAVATNRQQRAHFASQLANAAAALEAMTREGAPPTEAELTRAREARDHTWQRLEAARAIDPRAALVFRDELQQADALADRLRREAHRVAQRASIEAEISATRFALEAMEAEAAALAARGAAIEADWHEAWRALESPPLTPREMHSWRKRLDGVLLLATRLDQARAEAAELSARLELHRTGLHRALSAITPGRLPDSLAALVELAEARLAGIEALERARESAEKLAWESKAALQGAQAQRAAAEQELQDWRTEWRNTLATVGLSSELAPEEALAMLEVLDELSATTQERSSVEEKRARVAARIEELELSVSQLRETLAPELAGESAAVAVEALYRRVVEARKVSVTRTHVVEQLESATAALEDALLRERAAGEALRRLMAEAGAGDLHALEAAEVRSARKRQVEAELHELEARLLELGQGRSIKALAVEARELAADHVAVEVKRCQERLEAIERQRPEIDREIWSRRAQRDGKEGGDDAARAAQEAQAVAAELRVQIERHSKVRLASRLLQVQIDRYREEHAGPLLGRAAVLLERLTLGSLLRLEAAIDPGGRPILYGVRPSGQRVEVSGMSDGTRDQLYLALRIATLERYLGQRGAEPLPLVVDDILLNFDDARSEATLSVLGELSGLTQVMFFTHHARLVELARRVIPSERLLVHGLGGIAPQVTPEARVI